MNDHRNSPLNSNLPDAAARHRARDLALDALSAETEEAAEEMARRALAIDPNCSDALLLLAQLEELQEPEFVAALEAAVAAAERNLPAGFIEQHRGHLGEQEDAHPYLRARHQLALALFEGGEEGAEDEEIDQAIAHLEDLLDLAPEEYLGFAYILLGAYLIDQRLVQARQLLERFSEDTGLVMQLGRVMVLAKAGEREQARLVLQQAVLQNRNLRAALAHPEVLGKPVEDDYEPGSPDEARHALQVTLFPFMDDPELVQWLTAELQPQGRNDRCRCGSGKKFKDCCGR